MELNFSNKGLCSFDGVALARELQQTTREQLVDSDSEALQIAPPQIAQIDLSHNLLRLFAGGERLVGLSVLNLSHNKLTVLACSSLPPTLKNLDVSHNKLTELRALSSYAPRLQELYASQNAFTSAGFQNLPASLTRLEAASNELDSLDFVKSLSRLVFLDVSANFLLCPDEVAPVRHCRSLRCLCLTENKVMEELEGTALLEAWAPQLASLNGVSLSQAAQQHQRRRDGGGERRGGHTAAASPAKVTPPTVGLAVREPAAGKASSRLPLVESATQVSMLQTKVSELRRLLAASKEEELRLRAERDMLEGQCQTVASVLESQAAELEELRGEVEKLEALEEEMQEPLRELEHAFERTHASVVAHRLEESRASHDTSTKTVNQP